MWNDELTRRYAEDGGGASASVVRPSLEGSALLNRAAAALRAELTEEGLRLAERSLSTFRQCSDTRGLADSARLVACAMIHQERRKEADRLLRDELAVFQTSASYSSKPAEARILQALADVSSDRRGQKKREEALKFAGQARDMAVDTADKGLEATALTVMAKIFIKFKGDRRACNKEGFRLAGKALELFRETKDIRGQAIASQHSAVAEANLQEFQSALQSMHAAVGFWKQCEDSLHEAQALLLMAEWLLHCQAPQRAGPFADQALALYKSLGVSGQRTNKALQLAVRAQIANGEPWRAIWTSEEAVARSRDRKDRRSEAQALLCLAEGYTCSPSGREAQEELANTQTKAKPPPQDAVAAMQQAVQIANELKDETLEAEVMTKLSSLHVKRVEMEEAIFAAHDALSHRQVKDPDGKGVAFQSLASAHLHQKDFATAERAARAARDVCRKDGRWQGDAAGVMAMADVLLAERRVDEAVDVAKEAQSLYHEHADRRGEAKALSFVAKARLSNEEYEKACFAAERAHELFSRVRDDLGMCETLVMAAQARNELLKKQQKESSAKLRGKKASMKAPLPWEDLSKATKVSNQAKEAAKKVNDVQAEAAALCILAQIHIFNGRPKEEIARTLEEAMVLAAEVDDPKSEATALLLQAQLHLEASELQDALKMARQAKHLASRSGDAAANAQVDALLDQLRGHEFRVDEAPRMDPRMAVGQMMALPMVQGPDAAMVRATIQEVTKKMVGSDNDIEADMPLMDIGINSMNAVLFRNKLTGEFKDVELPSTLVFDYPSVKALSGLVMEQATAAAMAAHQASMAAMPGAGAFGGYAMMPQPPSVNPAEINAKIQEVTKGMVGSDRNIDADMPLMDIGINSMNAVLFRNKLGTIFDGVELPNTLVFDYPTVSALSSLLVELTSR